MQNERLDRLAGPQQSIEPEGTSLKPYCSIANPLNNFTLPSKDCVAACFVV